MIAHCAAAFAGGITLWTFAEYALHNWYGHVARGRNHFSREHLRHHSTPGYFAPTRQKLAAAVPVWTLVITLSVLTMGWAPGLCFGAGFLGMYITYEVLHYRAHAAAPRTRYGRWLRRHHFHHHYKNPKANHGVTSSIWDLVFRTYDPPGRIVVPKKHVMAWLTDPETGDVWPQHADDYAVSRRAVPL